MSEDIDIQHLMYFLDAHSIEDFVTSTVIEVSTEQVRNFKVYSSDFSILSEDLTYAFALIDFKKLSLKSADLDEGPDGEDGVKEVEKSESLERMTIGNLLLNEKALSLNESKNVLIGKFQKQQNSSLHGNGDNKNLINKKAG